MDLEKAIYLANTQLNDLTQDYPFLATWKIGFDNAKRRAGLCDLNNKIIKLSRVHIRLNEEAMVMDTILHELAHAICFHLYKEVGHGRRWKEVAKMLGATPKATGNFNLPDTPWLLVHWCKRTNQLAQVGQRYRRSKGIKRYYLKGRPESQGELYFISRSEFRHYETGLLKLQELNLTQ
ncbi:SprT-like domain-containing protein [Aliikangiella sp. IMCC44653]